MNQAYSRLSTTHGDINDCKLLVCMYWTRLVLVRPAASLYSASPLKHHPTGALTKVLTARIFMSAVTVYVFSYYVNQLLCSDTALCHS